MPRLGAPSCSWRAGVGAALKTSIFVVFLAHGSHAVARSFLGAAQGPMEPPGASAAQLHAETSAAAAAAAETAAAAAALDKLQTTSLEEDEAAAFAELQQRVASGAVPAVQLEGEVKTAFLGFLQKEENKIKELQKAVLAAEGGEGGAALLQTGAAAASSASSAQQQQQQQLQQQQQHDADEPEADEETPPNVEDAKALWDETKTAARDHFEDLKAKLGEWKERGQSAAQQLKMGLKGLFGKAKKKAKAAADKLGKKVRTILKDLSKTDDEVREDLFGDGMHEPQDAAAAAAAAEESGDLRLEDALGPDQQKQQQPQQEDSEQQQHKQQPEGPQQQGQPEDFKLEDAL
ncbi:hypothetical protein, conserved [Eimeria tenella]|uniref:Uncharacterized protein n=1 Tax=Eimeria tenella TaxID=5802 RepID=U6KTF2_EIMTE|nr:hypothetical protein, conserved [Eimeria tenella]CDJ41392.1 hypothetical protein, conserved [Eimeria tenella]|eukprot:XP_013232142.1 hypothetical protein, conserved [Eimeria tenella]